MSCIIKFQSQVRLQIDANRLDIVDVVIPKSDLQESQSSSRTPSPKSQGGNLIDILEFGRTFG